MQNLLDDEKQRLVEYINNHFIMCKYVFLFFEFWLSASGYTAGRRFFEYLFHRLVFEI